MAAMPPREPEGQGPRGPTPSSTDQTGDVSLVIAASRKVTRPEIEARTMSPVKGAQNGRGPLHSHSHCHEGPIVRG